MSKGKNKGKSIYGIIGLGRFGMSLAMELSNAGADIIVLDQDEVKASILREHVENVFVVKNLEKHTLLEAGLGNCDVVIVCIAEQVDISIMTTLNLVEMGIPTVIAKASSSEHGRVLEKLGAQVVYPEKDMAVRLASRLESGMMLDFVRLSEKINISKIVAPEHIIGKTIVSVDIRSRFGLNIIAIESNGNVLDKITPDYLFKENDILYMAGDKNSLIKFSNWN